MREREKKTRLSNLLSERGGPSGSFEFPICVRVCVAWRGGPPGGRMGGEGLRRVASGRAGLLGGGVFRGAFRVTGHAGKRSPERDLRIGVFRTSHPMFFI